MVWSVVRSIQNIIYPHCWWIPGRDSHVKFGKIIGLVVFYFLLWLTILVIGFLILLSWSGLNQMVIENFFQILTSIFRVWWIGLWKWKMQDIFQINWCRRTLYIETSLATICIFLLFGCSRLWVGLSCCGLISYLLCELCFVGVYFMGRSQLKNLFIIGVFPLLPIAIFVRKVLKLWLIFSFIVLFLG